MTEFLLVRKKSFFINLSCIVAIPNPIQSKEYTRRAHFIPVSRCQKVRQLTQLVAHQFWRHGELPAKLRREVIAVAEATGVGDIGNALIAMV